MCSTDLLCIGNGTIAFEALTRIPDGQSFERKFRINNAGWQQLYSHPAGRDRTTEKKLQINEKTHQLALVICGCCRMDRSMATDQNAFSCGGERLDCVA